jgi:hypothetical protein
MNTGLPKFKVTGKGETFPKAQKLTKSSKIGDYVYWKLSKGVIIHIDKNIIIIQTPDSKKITIPTIEI